MKLFAIKFTVNRTGWRYGGFVAVVEAEDEVDANNIMSELTERELISMLDKTEDDSPVELKTIGNRRVIFIGGYSE